MDSNVGEIKYTFTACLAEVPFLTVLEQITNKDARFAAFLIAIFILIAKAIEIQRFLFFKNIKKYLKKLYQLKDHKVEDGLKADIFRGNKFEFAVLDDFLKSKALTCKDIFDEINNKYVKNNNFKYIVNKYIVNNPIISRINY